MISGQFHPLLTNTHTDVHILTNWSAHEIVRTTGVFDNMASATPFAKCDAGRFDPLRSRNRRRNCSEQQKLFPYDPPCRTFPVDSRRFVVQFYKMAGRRAVTIQRDAFPRNPNHSPALRHCRIEKSDRAILRGKTIDENRRTRAYKRRFH